MEHLLLHSEHGSAQFPTLRACRGEEQRNFGGGPDVALQKMRSATVKTHQSPARPPFSFLLSFFVCWCICVHTSEDLFNWLKSKAVLKKETENTLLCLQAAEGKEMQ